MAVRGFHTHLLALCGIVGLLSPYGAGGNPDPPCARAEGICFTDITESLGISVPVGQPQPNFPVPEIIGSGVALFDYDNDGDLDIYLVRGSLASSPTSMSRNLLFQQGSDGRFVEVGQSAGLADEGFGMGVAIGDIDRDGRLDVFLSNWGQDRLFLNLGGGRFEDISLDAGTSSEGWSASAVFCDYDQDGWLDLYVTRYLTYNPTIDCVGQDGRPEYCGPRVFRGVSDLLYHNEGDSTFRDVSLAAGIKGSPSRGLGVICADINGDSQVDFFVTNDGEPNQLWLNQGNGTFLEDAFLSGLAVNAMGRSEAGMGVAFGDVDGDGDFDLLLAHLSSETHTLYRNDGGLGFEDTSVASGIARLSRGKTGFGVGFGDFDHDGDLDLAVVNGHIERKLPDGGTQVTSSWSPYGQENLLFLNDGEGRFEAMPDPGDFSLRSDVSRGLALGDLDNDGDLDLVVTHAGGFAQVFRNDSVKQGNWLMIRAVDPRRGGEVFGALVTLRVNRREFRRLVHPGYGYLSSSDSRAHFGISNADLVEEVTVLWPDGTVEHYAGGPVNRFLTLEKGGGRGETTN